MVKIIARKRFAYLLLYGASVLNIVFNAPSCNYSQTSGGSSAVSSSSMQPKLTISLTSGPLTSDGPETEFCECEETEVSIMHVPPGNPQEKHPLCISPSAQIAHYAHHDDYPIQCSNIRAGQKPDLLKLNILSVEAITPQGESIPLQMAAESSIFQIDNSYTPIVSASSISPEEAAQVSSIKIQFGQNSEALYSGHEEHLEIQNPNLTISIPIEFTIDNQTTTMIELEFTEKSAMAGESELTTLFGELTVSGFETFQNSSVQNVINDLTDAEGNSITIAMPIGPQETQTKLLEIEANPPQFIPENEIKPNMYHAIVFLDSPEKMAILHALEIYFDYFPLFDEGSDLSEYGSGMLDLDNYSEGLFVYCVLSDFQHNLLVAFPVVRAFSILREVNYEELVLKGFHAISHPTLSPEELGRVEGYFQEVIATGQVTFPPEEITNTVNTPLLYDYSQMKSSYLAGNYAWSIGGGGTWKKIKNSVSNGATTIITTMKDAVNIATDAANNYITEIGQTLAIVTSGFETGQFRGYLGFSERLSDGSFTPFARDGNIIYLPDTQVKVRARDFFANGDIVRTNQFGYFETEGLATNFLGDPIYYTLRVELNNPSSAIYNSNSIWPVVIQMEGGRVDNQEIYKLYGRHPNLHVYGVTHYARMQTKMLFQFQPSKAKIYIGGPLMSILENRGITTSAFVPEGNLRWLIPVNGILMGKDGDIYYKASHVRWDVGTIVHEYGHHVLFEKLEQRVDTDVFPLLLKYLHEVQQDQVGSLIQLQPNMVQFIEAWAEFFAYTVLSHNDENGNPDSPNYDERIGGYLNFDYTKHNIRLRDGLAGLEANFGSKSANDVLKESGQSLTFPQTLEQLTIGRGASLLNDLYDVYRDTDTYSGKTDMVSIGSAFLNVVRDAAPAANENQNTYHLYRLYSYLINHGSFTTTQIKDIYKMHGFAFPLNKPEYAMGVVIEGGTLRFDMTPHSYVSGINSNTVRFFWSSSITGSYHLNKGSDCAAGLTPPLVEGSMTADNMVTNTIAMDELSIGGNDFYICSYDDGILYELHAHMIRDDQPPITYASTNYTESGTPILQLRCTDNEQEGCKYIIYTVDGAEPSFYPPNGVFVSGNIVQKPTVCTTHFKFRSVDAAGNQEAVQVYTIDNGVDCCTLNNSACYNNTLCKIVYYQPVRNSPCWGNFFGFEYCKANCPCYDYFPIKSCTTIQVCPDLNACIP